MSFFISNDDSGWNSILIVKIDQRGGAMYRWACSDGRSRVDEDPMSIISSWFDDDFSSHNGKNHVIRVDDE
jgi:hypothetical protein